MLALAVPAPPKRRVADPAKHWQFWAPALDSALRSADAMTSRRAACFLAQWGHETISFSALREIWGPTAAQACYEGRKDLGNTEPGDGKRFLGRGLPHVTGRHNYRLVAEAIGQPLLERPDLLEIPEYAAAAGAWWWRTFKLNDLADKLEFERMTRRINGGLNGFPDRCARLAQALAALDTVLP